MKNKRAITFAIALILGFLAFRIYYLAHTGYNLADDEAYFWDWSRHPALGYYDQGPMVAWIIRFFTSFLPLSEFSVRLGAPVFAALSALVIFVLAAGITESVFLGLLVVLLFHITPIGATGGIIMTYYAPQVLFMSLAAYFLWRLVKNGRGFWWYLTGVCLGLGLLSHHMFIFFAVEAGLFTLLSQNGRKWLKRKEPYLALLVMLLTASPIIIWNFNHNLVMFRHALGMMSEPRTIAAPANEFLQYVTGQAGVHTPLFFLTVLYGIAVSGYRGIRLKSDKYLLLFCLSAPVILFVALLGIGGRTEANWPVSGYITGSIAVVWVLSEKYRNGGRLFKIFVATSLALTLIICFFASAIIYYPSFASGLGIDISPKNDPANRLYGWKELGREVTKALKEMPEGTFVAASGYGQAAELAFYVEGHPQVYEIPINRRFSQYDIWNETMNINGRDAVFADYRPMSKGVEDLFEKVSPAGQLIIRDQQDRIRRKFYIYKYYGYKGSPKKLFKF